MASQQLTDQAIVASVLRELGVDLRKIRLEIDKKIRKEAMTVHNGGMTVKELKEKIAFLSDDCPVVITYPSDEGYVESSSEIEVTKQQNAVILRVYS